MTNTSTRTGAAHITHGGYTLIEVLVGIIIFALGMMALAQLQGSLAKNSADANARTVANNIAEEVIEAARVFSQITSDGTNRAYNDIVDSTRTENRGGVGYTVSMDVTDYYYDTANASFTTTAPPDVGASDMKLVELTVSWNTGQEFQIDESNATSGRLGSGSVKLTDVISSVTSGSGGKVVLSSPGDPLYGPPVDYSPGQNPDIISIQLGNNKFKESTTPLPDVVRADELVETRFDVVTYSQDDAGSTFLRREEFRAISCECILRAADSEGEGGLRPTIWGGYEYSEAEYVAKPWGASANNQQSDYCDLCCRDHHDGGTGENDQWSDPGRGKYNPFRADVDYFADGTFSGDHKHYNRDTDGNLVLADSDGDTYVEACRLIRKDGFFRVGQDLRQEGLNAFPADYLDEEAEVAEYSGYVTGVVTAYEQDVGATNLYELSPPLLMGPDELAEPLVFPASNYENASSMSSSTVTEQQLRSRGIYIDYMSDDLRVKINCLDIGGSAEACETPGVTSSLEIIPFYDVQLTWLSRWNETPNNNPVDVSNEAVQDNNVHSRGVATLEAGFGYSTVTAAAHTGNLGLTATDPVDPRYSWDEEFATLYVLAYDASSPPPLSGVVVAGNITSSVPGVNASDVEIEATDAQCDRTNTGFECVIESDATAPRLKVFNYEKANTILYACSDIFTIQGQEHTSDNGYGNWTRFILPLTATSTAHIVIREDSC